MAYLSPQYKHDLFISYSHGDVEQNGMSQLAAWSQDFAKTLESELRLDPKFVNAGVFFDASRRPEQGLDRMHPLADAIRQNVKDTGLLLILMSPHYVRSSWCRTERELWSELHGPSGNFWNRTLVARIWPTQDTEWPKELRDSEGHPPLGIWCHTRLKSGSGVRPFRWNGRTDEINEYTDAVMEFVTTITRRLDELQAQLEAQKKAQEEAKRLGADEGQALYLHCREVYREAWIEAYGALNNLGYIVTPAQPEQLPDSPERMRAISQERVSLLSECDALLLLGTKDGFALDGDMLSVGRQTRNLARARSEKLLPCAVLDKSGGSIATEQRLAAARKMNIGWIDGLAPDWQDRLRLWLQGMRSKLDAVA
jgi:MTH538 TIR-like domain (DUF1863)